MNEEKYGARKMCREVPVGSSAGEGDLNRSGCAAEAGAQAQVPSSPQLKDFRLGSLFYSQNNRTGEQHESSSIQVCV